jgi:hypothetical protein
MCGENKKLTVAKQADSDDVATSVHTLFSLTLRASLVVVFLKKSAYKL